MSYIWGIIKKYNLLLGDEMQSLHDMLLRWNYQTNVNVL